jgi:hypothetical protein
MPRTSFGITSIHKPKTYILINSQKKTNKYFFCGDCGSNLYTELAMMPEAVCVKAGCLDGGMADIKPAFELFVQERKGYVSVVDGAEQRLQMGEAP